MKITKLGHCCLVIEEKGLKILTDPGSYTDTQNNIKEINVILITHEHGDHLHIESLKTVLQNNPNAKIFTNKGVGQILEKEQIKYELLEHGQSNQIKDVLIEGFGQKHADIYSTIEPMDNTGYFIDNRFFYPGDAFTDPQKPVEVLALPIIAPWLKISEALDYAKNIKPQICFPVHDGILKRPLGATHKLPEKVLTPLGIKFLTLQENPEIDL